MAIQVGYKESRPQVSSTIFLVQTHTTNQTPPVKVHIYHTTRSIMTVLDHPTQGVNRLWRSRAYETLEELKEFLLDPRKHTQKGYRKASDASRVCVACQELKTRLEFSANQWQNKGPDANVCKECVEKKQNGSFVDKSDEMLSRLTEKHLRIHDKYHHQQQQQETKQKQPSTQKTFHDRMERRLFNCPDCPKHGRGRFQFFKKVPAMKPIVKCPQCKQATRGRCKRLYPVPVAKGYGLFFCHKCRDKWGSSRAVEKVGQQCANCKDQGVETMVKPFRLEVLKKKKKKKAAAGGDVAGGDKTGRRIPRYTPKHPIGEETVEDTPYSTNDHNRNATGAGNALVRGMERSYQIDTDSSGESSESWQVIPPPITTPASLKYDHKCEACLTGACRSRRVEQSQVHDISDGNTVSTSASLVTNSSVDKAEYVDRDEDFSGFEEDGWVEEEDQEEVFCV